MLGTLLWAYVNCPVTGIIWKRCFPKVLVSFSYLQKLLGNKVKIDNNIHITMTLNVAGVSINDDWGRYHHSLRANIPRIGGHLQPHCSCSQHGLLRVPKSLIKIANNIHVNIRHCNYCTLYCARHYNHSIRNCNHCARQCNYCPRHCDHYTLYWTRTSTSTFATAPLHHHCCRHIHSLCIFLQEDLHYKS